VLGIYSTRIGKDIKSDDDYVLYAARENFIALVCRKRYSDFNTERIKIISQWFRASSDRAFGRFIRRESPNDLVSSKIFPYSVEIRERF